LNIPKKILAIVPARGGSKGLPQKNILDCAGKPLIAWSIEAALKSKYVDRVLISTDCDKIAKIAKNYNAWVPFIRSPNLAKDDSSSIDVVKDALIKAKNDGYEAEYLVLLQPTSPLRSTIHIDEAIERYFSSRLNDTDTLVSVKEIDNKVLWVMEKDNANGYLSRLFKNNLENKHRRQDLPRCYIPNGAIYIANVEGFDNFFGDNTLSYMMDEKSSIDIDYQQDIDEVKQILKLDDS
jgi:CMP-N,N'-diacetyllegionaminic acid synthase